MMAGRSVPKEKLPAALHGVGACQRYAVRSGFLFVFEVRSGAFASLRRRARLISREYQHADENPKLPRKLRILAF